MSKGSEVSVGPRWKVLAGLGDRLAWSPFPGSETFRGYVPTVFVLRMLRVTRTVTLVPVDTHSQDQETGVLHKHAGLQFSIAHRHTQHPEVDTFSQLPLAGRTRIGLSTVRLRPSGGQGKQLTAPLPTPAREEPSPWLLSPRLP